MADLPLAWRFPARARPLLERLPPRAARSLGAALARVAGIPATADGDLRAAFPDEKPASRRALARAAWAARGAAIGDDASAARRGAVALCRRLTLTGWDRLRAAEEERDRVLVVAPALGAFELARRALEVYRGADEAMCAEAFAAAVARRRPILAAVMTLESGGRLRLTVGEPLPPDPAGALAEWIIAAVRQDPRLRPWGAAAHGS